MSPADGTKVIGYTRVSLQEQGDSRLGLEAQEAAIRAACESRGWQLVEIVQEVGSGRDVRKRPKLRDLMDRLESRKPPADALVVAKLDRLTRSVVDGGRIFERSTDKGWGLVALDMGIDTTTASGRLVANLMVAVGQWEREIIAERTSAALKAKAARGEPVGRPRTLSPHVIERITAMRSEGLSYRAIAERLGTTKQNVYATCKRYGITKAAA